MPTSLFNKKKSRHHKRLKALLPTSANFWLQVVYKLICCTNVKLCIRKTQNQWLFQPIPLEIQFWTSSLHSLMVLPRSRSFSSPITGILILAGVFIASRKAGMMMVLSGLIGAGLLFWPGLLMTWSLSVCSVITQYSLEWHFGQGRLSRQIGPLSLSQCLGRL